MPRGVTLALFGIALLGGITAVTTLTEKSSFQVVGRLSAADGLEVERLARRELRGHLIPYLDWDWDCPKYFATHPIELVRDLREYHAQKLLWANVHPDGSVTAFMGVSKSNIRSKGYAVSLRKNSSRWELADAGEFGYWAQWSGGPSIVTSNLSIPPGP
jgi:hypothetical protein